MSVEQANVIDGIGLEPGGPRVELFISDHLEWEDVRHFELLSAKIEAYANAILSGELVESYPAASGKPACITIVWEHVPNGDAVRYFETVQEQLGNAGIAFEQMTLPEGY